MTAEQAYRLACTKLHNRFNILVIGIKNHVFQAVMGGLHQTTISLLGTHTVSELNAAVKLLQQEGYTVQQMGQHLTISWKPDEKEGEEKKSE